MKKISATYLCSLAEALCDSKGHTFESFMVFDLLNELGLMPEGVEYDIYGPEVPDGQN